MNVEQTEGHRGMQVRSTETGREAFEPITTAMPTVDKLTLTDDRTPSTEGLFVFKKNTTFT